MESNSSTIVVPSEVQTEDIARTKEHRRERASWAVVFAAFFAVVVLAIAAWIGGASDQGARTTPIDPRAERVERAAHLDGQDRTYRSDHPVLTDAWERAARSAASKAEPSFVPGSRHVPTR